MVDLAKLLAPMEDRGWDGGHIRLEPLGPGHKEGLRACCDPADPVWEIYPVNYSGEGFDLAFDLLPGHAQRNFFAILQDGVVRGITSFMNIVPEKQSLEIGGTFMAPAARGTGLNSRVKPMLLDRAFACGIRRVQFLIDERNARSRAAVAKLGAVKEGVLRAERVTWTGHVRDTGVFSILAEEWRARG